MKNISLIIPAHNERVNIPLITAEIVKIFAALPYTFEIIFIDDGSRDDSAEVVKAQARKHRQVRLLEFSRNFGKEAATTAGFHNARGDAVICLDADLQHPPALIPEFLRAWEKGAEVVIGVRKNSASDTGIKRLGSSLYYKLINLISHTEIVPRSTDFRLLDRVVVDEFNALSEHNRMTRGLIDWLGFRRECIYFDAPERQHGEASYGFWKLLSLAVESFVAYSLLPLRLAGYIGALIMVLSGLLGLLMMFDRYIQPLGFDFSGPAILADIILFLVGVVLVSLGLLAYYIGHVYAETQNRPLYVVRKEPVRKARARVQSGKAQERNKDTVKVSNESAEVSAAPTRVPDEASILDSSQSI